MLWLFFETTELLIARWARGDLIARLARGDLIASGDRGDLIASSVISKNISCTGTSVFLSLQL